MTAGGRPASVRRFLRRPLGWATIALGVSAALVLVDVIEVRRQRRDLRSAVTVDAVVAPGYRGGPEVPLSYLNPVTEQRLDVKAYVWHDRLYPDPGQRVRALVDRGDPEDLVLAGDHFPVDANLWWYLPLVLAGLAIGAKRRLHVLQVERLVGAGEPSFAMVGVVTPPRRFARRCEVQLYPLDAPAGSLPLCAIPLLSTAGAPIGRPGVPVEVKGSPRPMGLVVARLGGGGRPAGVLWPAGRALFTASFPRPGEIAAPVELPAAPTPAPAAGGWRGWWRAAAVEVAALAVAVTVAVSVAAVTLNDGAQSRRHDRRAVTVIAQVASVDEASGTVTLSYSEPRTGAGRTGTAPADLPAGYRVGRRYPARAAPEAPGRLRFVREPYDVVEPLVWAALPVTVPLMLLGRRLWWARAARRMAGGPWRQVHAWPMAAAAGRRHSRIGLTPPGSSHLLCVIRVPPSLHQEIFGAPPPAPLAVAGTPEPGELIALAVGGRQLARAVPALAPGRDSVESA